MPNRQTGERPQITKPKRAAGDTTPKRGRGLSKSARRRHTKTQLEYKIVTSNGKLSGEELLQLIRRLGYTPNSVI